MPAWVEDGDPFEVIGYLDNPTDPRSQVPTFFILDVYGAYWFWPSWTEFVPGTGAGLDYRLTDLPTGTTTVQVIDEFTWPETGSGPMNALYFHGAMLDDTLSSVIGAFATVEWGFDS